MGRRKVDRHWRKMEIKATLSVQLEVDEFSFHPPAQLLVLVSSVFLQYLCQSTA